MRIEIDDRGRDYSLFYQPSRHSDRNAFRYDTVGGWLGWAEIELGGTIVGWEI